MVFWEDSKPRLPVSRACTSFKYTNTANVTVILWRLNHLKAVREKQTNS